jgi:IBR domain, a half RING-finger domain
VKAIKCADSGCKQEYTPDDIRKFGSKEIYEKYLKFKENIDVNMNPNLRWCPRPDCNNYVKKGKKGNQVKCECGYEICFKCGMQWHGKSKCEDVVDKDFFGWASGNGNIGNCPKCKARVEKISGCNHMTC